MEKLKLQTTNIVDENIRKIAELFPNCLTERLDEHGKPEAAIDFDMLRQELSKDIVEGPTERYQFTWPDKRNAIRLANAPTTDTLRPCREESVDFDNTQNLYIEGDNLEVLKLLRENYLGKVKMIYIDPPYNTGNDFVYNDDFAQTAGDYVHNSGQEDEEGNRLVANTESNGRFHTDWLNMIYPRLKVAKDLLSEDGVIFISIDDNEQENLKKVCDEVYGEKNFVGQWNWFKSATPPNLSKKIKKNIEYVICYQKGKNSNTFSGVQKTSSSDDPITKPQNSLKELTFKSGWIHAKFPDGIIKAGMYGTAKFPNELLNDMIVENGVNKNEVTFRNKFIWVQDTLDAQIKNGTRINLSKALVISYKKAEYSAEVPPNLIDDSVGVDTTEKAGDDLNDMFDGQTIFDYPKPVSLLHYLIDFDTPKENSIILDFFSGSATTAHAVMQLNAEDDGNRKFIMVQLPEATDEKSEAYKAGYKNICEIGKERIRRAGKQILDDIQLRCNALRNSIERMLSARPDATAQLLLLEQQKEIAKKIYEEQILPKQKELDELEERLQHLDIGFRVLKLDSSNMQDVYYRPEDSSEQTLFEDNIKPGRTSEDLLFQVMLECNLPLSAKIETEKIAGKEVFSVNEGYLIACFDEKVNEDVIKEVAKRKPYYFVMRDSSMETDNVADNFEQIFQAYSKDTIRKVL